MSNYDQLIKRLDCVPFRREAWSRDFVEIIKDLILEVADMRRQTQLTTCPPADWWTYHHKDCGTKYRGCHPSLCPKDQYAKTGVWIPEPKECE